ncbi:MAG: RnfABCDGE type electron transport complex subunit D [Oscillospiraceae bacterium]
MKNKTISILKSSDNYKTQLDIILSLLPLGFLSYFLYGARPIIITALAAYTAYLCDLIWFKLGNQKKYILDLSSITSVIIMSYLFPASVSYSVVVISSIFAVVVGKQVFGGYGSNIFNISSVGFCFAAITFTQDIYMYPKPLNNLPLFIDNTVNLVSSPIDVLKQSGVPFVQIGDLILGNYPGPFGAISIVVLLSSGLFLYLRKRISWQIPVTFLSTVIILSFFFPRIVTGSFDSVIYEVLAKPIIFIAIFIATDPVTSPVKDESKIFYGITLGIVSFIFEYISPFSVSTLFAVIILNALSSYYDRVLTPYLINFDYENIYESIKALLLRFQKYIMDIAKGVDRDGLKIIYNSRDRSAETDENETTIINLNKDSEDQYTSDYYSPNKEHDYLFYEKDKQIPEKAKRDMSPKDSNAPAEKAKTKKTPEKAKSNISPKDSNTPVEKTKTKKTPEKAKSNISPKDSNTPAEKTKTKKTPEKAKSNISPKDGNTPVEKAKTKKTPEKAKRNISPKDSNTPTEKEKKLSNKDNKK